jgi:hypothetical protein
VNADEGRCRSLPLDEDEEGARMVNLSYRAALAAKAGTAITGDVGGGWRKRNPLADERGRPPADA